MFEGEDIEKMLRSSPEDYSLCPKIIYDFESHKLDFDLEAFEVIIWEYAQSIYMTVVAAFENPPFETTSLFKNLFLENDQTLAWMLMALKQQQSLERYVGFLSNFKVILGLVSDLRKAKLQLEQAGISLQAHPGKLWIEYKNKAGSLEKQIQDVDYPPLHRQAKRLRAVQSSSADLYCISDEASNKLLRVEAKKSQKFSHVPILTRLINSNSYEENEYFNGILMSFVAFIEYPYPPLFKSLSLDEKMTNIKLHLMLKGRMDPYEAVKKYFADPENLRKKIDSAVISRIRMQLTLRNFDLTKYIDTNVLAVQLQSFYLQYVNGLMSTVDFAVEKIKKMDSLSVQKLIDQIKITDVAIRYFDLVRVGKLDLADLLKIYVQDLSLDHKKQLTEKIGSIRRLLSKVGSNGKARCDSDHVSDDQKLLEKFCQRLGEKDISTVCLKAIFSGKNKISDLELLKKVVLLYENKAFNDILFPQLEYANSQKIFVNNESANQCVIFFLKKSPDRKPLELLGENEKNERFYNLLNEMGTQEVVQAISEFRFCVFIRLDLDSFINLINVFYKALDPERQRTFQIGLGQLSQPKYLNNFITPVLTKMKEMLKEHLSVSENLTHKPAKELLPLFFKTLSTATDQTMQLIFQDIKKMQESHQGFLENILHHFLEHRKVDNTPQKRV